MFELAKEALVFDDMMIPTMIPKRPSAEPKICDWKQAFRLEDGVEDGVEQEPANLNDQNLDKHARILRI